MAKGDKRQNEKPSNISRSSTSTKTNPPPEIKPYRNPAAEGGSSSTTKFNFPNPPDSANPDPATLREQWRFAIKQYSRWYSHAWGTAILAGLSFFALGWVIKGGNPLPCFHNDDKIQQKEDKNKS